MHRNFRFYFSLCVYPCSPVTKKVSKSLWLQDYSQASLYFPISRICSNSCPLSRWCHPDNSSLVVPFPFCLQSSPASGSFPKKSVPESGGQSIGASALAPVLPMNILEWFLFSIDWFYLLADQGTLKSHLQGYNSKASILQGSAFFPVQLSHSYITAKFIALTMQAFLAWWYLCFLLHWLDLSQHLLRSECLLIS